MRNKPTKKCLDCKNTLLTQSAKRCLYCSFKYKKLFPEKRFFRNVKKTRTCWLWTAYRFPKGYGGFWIEGRTRFSHRVAWVFKNGKIKEDKFILHKCDNPPCVNPKHLFIGTTQDNVDDKIGKGRQLHGEKHTNAKLTWNQVQQIRKYSGMITYREFSRVFGVHYSVIGDIIKFRKWKIR